MTQMVGLFLFQDKPSGCRYLGMACHLEQWFWLAVGKVWRNPGMRLGDFNVRVEHLPLSRKKQGKTAGEQFLPLT